MPAFFNQAALTYNGVTTSSNIVSGEIIDELAVNKSAVTTTYTQGEKTTFVVNIINSGTNAFSGLTLTDDLGAFTYNSQELYPLTYVTGSANLYVNGVQQTAPTVTDESPLTITGISIPAGANAAIVYEVTPNTFASPEAGGTVTNTATLSGTGLNSSMSASASVTASDTPALAISKAISPAQVTDGSSLTYTFTIQNFGNSAVTADGNAIVTDTLNPILNPITVTFNGTAWMAGPNYTYDTTTGAFATAANQITVPAATYTRDTSTGAYSVVPGVSTIVLTGTV